MVFYLKYRPQSLDELLGQTQVKRVLDAASKSDKLAHAYLFCGPRGTGKTSTARILAKIVNCESSTPPCNKCETCTSITDGSNLDLIEIDAASNRGIDDIRELRDNIKLSPSKSKKKVYIIDEVHMLTTEAFNALLKTLEEPPAHVLFILATTESHKIPQTILSRVQRLDFELASIDELLKALENIVTLEKIDIEKSAIELIAKRGMGSFRDSEKLLDQVASMGGKITVLMVEEMLKSGGAEDMSDFLEALSKKHTKTCLDILTKQIEAGVSLKEFNLSILENLRESLLSFHGGSSKGLDKFEQTHLLKVINNFIDCQEKLKYVSLPSLPLEVAIIESCVSSEIISSSPAVIMESPVVIDSPIPQQVTSDEINKVLDKWTYILETIKPFNFSLEALLKQARVASVDEGLVILEVPYSFHQRILEAPKSRDLLESVLSDVLGKSAKVSCVLGKRPVRIEEIANVELAADDEVVRLAAEIFNS